MKTGGLILAVDDQPNLREYVQQVLTLEGYQVLTARNGVEALEILESHPVNLILADIAMPRMNGYELTEQVRDDPHYKDIPIIIITSRSGAKHRNRAMELGATLYLTKPYQEQELMEAINSVLPAESSRKISIMMEA